MISQSRYIRIVSGVGAGAAVAERQLIMRIITQNTTLPPGVVAEFSTPDAVGAYFGIASEEYQRALAYFSFISKSINSPALISFARWVDQAIPPMIVGDALEKTVSQFASISAGTLKLMVGATPINLSNIDVSGKADLTAVGAAVQAAIRLNADPQLTGAVVSYNTNTNQFVLTGTVAGSGAITCLNDPSASDIGKLLGWSTAGATNVAGQAGDSPDAAIMRSADISNNFGSFVFATPKVAFTDDQIVAIAAWNDAQNNLYMYSVGVPVATAQALYDRVKGYSGLALNWLSATVKNDFVEQSPCEILAATDYSRVNSTQNYMFYQFPNRTVTVQDDNTADMADAIRLNYIGVTQSAGQPLAFYQRGLLCGGSQAAVDMNIYANEMWLKSAITTQILSLFLNLPTIPANTIGEAMILGALMSVVTRGKDNGTISAGKNLTETQKQYINRLSGDPLAWRQVSTLGFWIDISFESYVNNNTGLTEWKAKYMLIYSKDDAIRLVEGNDVMI